MCRVVVAVCDVAEAWTTGTYHLCCVISGVVDCLWTGSRNNSSASSDGGWVGPAKEVAVAPLAAACFPGAQELGGEE